MVAIDHTELDIIVLDDSREHAVGRPWITLAIDIFSRMIVGYYIAFEKPGALAVGMCISRCILPKDSYLARLNLQVEWPVQGIMKAIQTDNAKEFRSKSLGRALEFYGIEHNFRPPQHAALQRPRRAAYADDARETAYFAGNYLFESCRQRRLQVRETRLHDTFRS
jgi:transposase InsO family protein